MRYVGEFANGVREGQGKASCLHGTYEGGWADDEFSGFGTHVVHVSDSCFNRVRVFPPGIYRGNHVLGFREGRGAMTLPNGMGEYDGHFKFGEWAGEGSFVSNLDGTIFTGVWDKPDDSLFLAPTSGDGWEDSSMSSLSDLPGSAGESTSCSRQRSTSASTSASTVSTASSSTVASIVRPVPAGMSAPLEL